MKPRRARSDVRFVSGNYLETRPYHICRMGITGEWNDTVDMENSGDQQWTA